MYTKKYVVLLYIESLDWLLSKIKECKLSRKTIREAESSMGLDT